MTASHNPPEYNGYKAYWEDGAQVTAPKDKDIIEEVRAVTDYNDVKTMDKQEAMDKGPVSGDRKRDRRQIHGRAEKTDHPSGSDQRDG